MTHAITTQATCVPGLTLGPEHSFALNVIGGNPLVVRWLRIHLPGDTSPIPGWGTKISQAVCMALRETCCLLPSDLPYLLCPFQERAIRKTWRLREAELLAQRHPEVAKRGDGAQVQVQSASRLTSLPRLSLHPVSSTLPPWLPPGS